MEWDLLRKVFIVMMLTFVIVFLAIRVMAFVTNG